jgi:ferritin-like metal-binding protein YciE
MTTNTERLVTVEVEVRELKKAFEEHKQETRDDLAEIKTQLADLLELKNKGMGAFWLASAVVGSGIVSIIWQFINWLRG